MSTNTETNYFAELAKINVNEHIERKGQFSYLSWPYAVAQLRQFDPRANWEVRRFTACLNLGHRSRCLRRGGRDGEGCDAQSDTSCAGWEEPPPDGTEFIRPSIPASSAVWSRLSPCMGWPLHLRGEDLPDSETETSARTSSPSSQLSQPGSVRQFPKPKTAGAEPELLTPNQLRFIKS